MIPNLDVYNKLFEFAGAFSVLTGGFAWWRRGSQDEDEMVAQAADTVLDSLSDADTVGKIDCITDRNIRDQLSIEEVLELDRERQLRRYERRN